MGNRNAHNRIKEADTASHLQDLILEWQREVFGWPVGLHKSLRYAITCLQHQQFNGNTFLKSKASGPRWPFTLFLSRKWRLICFTSAWYLVCEDWRCCVLCLLQRSYGPAAPIDDRRGKRRAGLTWAPRNWPGTFQNGRPGRSLATSPRLSSQSR